MRDTSHQVEGAAALGLFGANQNMLGRFAGSAAASRNWAGFWEIDENGKPSSWDYNSDDDFWFNLPANFDVLDAAVRMWRWTGDDVYSEDPRFQIFYRETLTDYIKQWQLEPELILSRPRIANLNSVSKDEPSGVCVSNDRIFSKGSFAPSRGIPSYNEGAQDFILGTDLLAAEYRAIRSYREIAVRAEDRALAERLQPAADKLQQILETVGWSQQQGHFFGEVRSDHSGTGFGDTWLLYFGAIKDPDHLLGAVEYVSNPEYWSKINIEEETYVPTVLFRYGRADTAYRVLFDLVSPRDRLGTQRNYPEVSYAVIAAIITGAMGIEPAHGGDAYDVQTLPQPQDSGDIMSVDNLHIKHNVLDISHMGAGHSRVVNHNGPELRWRAAFVGDIDKFTVDGQERSAEHGSLPGGEAISWTTIVVPPGGAADVSTR